MGSTFDEKKLYGIEKIIRALKVPYTFFGLNIDPI